MLNIYQDVSLNLGTLNNFGVEPVADLSALSSLSHITGRLVTIVSGGGTWTDNHLLLSNGSSWKQVALKDDLLLSGLLDTSISSPADGDLLQYESSTSKWKNYSVANAGTNTGKVAVIDSNLHVKFRTNSEFLTDVGLAGTYFAQGGNAFATTATLGTTDSNPLDIVINGTRVARAFVGGNISLGTGTTDNGYKLDITGTLRTTGNATVEGNTLTLGSGTTSGIVITASSGATGKSIESYGSHILQLNPSANNVMVGTSSDLGVKLGVSGTFKSTGGAVIETITVGLGPGSVASNTMFGYQAGNSNTSSYNLTYIGYQAGFSTVGSADDNVLIGWKSGYSVNSYSITAVGAESLYNLTGATNSAFGFQAGKKISSGTNNTIIGAVSAANGSTTSASWNTVVGHGSFYNLSGNFNTAIGATTGVNSTGSLNVFVGYNSGSQLTSGSSNLFLGNFDGTGFTTVSNNVFISDGDGNVRARADASGNWIFGGTTSGGYKVDVQGTLRVSGNTTLATVAAGIWNGTIIDPTYGGTGVNNGSSTLTMAGSHILSGAFTSTFTFTGTTSVTFPTSGTLITTANVSGTSGKIAKFTGTNTVGDSIIGESASKLTFSGSTSEDLAVFTNTSDSNKLYLGFALGAQLGFAGATIGFGTSWSSSMTYIQAVPAASSPYSIHNSQTGLIFGRVNYAKLQSGTTGFSFIGALPNSGYGIFGFSLTNNAQIQHTSGIIHYVHISKAVDSFNTFNPSSGTGVMNYLYIDGVINQTGTASGNVRGIYINQTLTSVLGSYRAVEMSNNTGWGIYQSGASALNHFNANTIFGGTTNAGYKVDVQGTFRVSSTSLLTGAVTASSTINSLYVKGVSRNVIVSTGSAASLTSGDDNVIMGDLAANAITTGYRNTIIGSSAARGLTDGYYNTFVGYQSGWNGSGGPTSAGENVGIGYQSCIGGGYGTVGIGNYAARVTTGNFATAVGYNAAVKNTAGQTVALGASALYNTVTGVRQTGLGYEAGYNSTGNDNVFIGNGAGKSNTTGIQNVVIGSQAMTSGTSTGSANCLMGTGVAFYMTSGQYNTLIGDNTGVNVSSGSYNSAFGSAALYQTTTGSYNIGIGHRALTGNSALTGDGNIGVGYETMRFISSTATQNTAIGTQAGYNITTGTYNILLGYRAGYSITSGSYNVVLGSYSAASYATDSNSVFISDGQGNLRMRIPSTGNVLINTTTDGGFKLEVNGTTKFQSKTTWDSTITPGGTTGAQTINKPSGTVNIAAGVANVTVTNSLVTASSIVHVVVRTNDATAVIGNCVPGSGSFTINMMTAPTAEISIGFLVIN